MEESGVEDSSAMADSSSLFSRYRDLLESVGDEDLNLKDKEEIVVEEALLKADHLFAEVDNTRLCVLDAQLIERISDFCVRNARSVNTNLQSFTQEEFASKISSYVKASSEGSRYKLKASDWVRIGKGTQSLFPRIPYLSYLHGSLHKTPPAPSIKKQRAPRMSSANAAQGNQKTQSTLLSESDMGGSGSNATTEVLVESTFRQLVREFKRSERRPVNLFQFILDPSSFSKTVENIFHLSFLIHEGKVAMVLEEEECPWPFIHPVKQKKGGGERGEDYADEEKPPKYQSVLSMQMNEWEDLKEYFGTKEPLIDHEVFLSREKEEGKKRARR